MSKTLLALARRCSSRLKPDGLLPCVEVKSKSTGLDNLCVWGKKLKGWVSRCKVQKGIRMRYLGQAAQSGPGASSEEKEPSHSSLVRVLLCRSVCRRLMEWGGGGGFAITDDIANGPDCPPA